MFTTDFKTKLHGLKYRDARFSHVRTATLDKSRMYVDTHGPVFFILIQTSTGVYVEGWNVNGRSDTKFTTFECAESLVCDRLVAAMDTLTATGQAGA